jgi:general secretion pathway protein F
MALFSYKGLKSNGQEVKASINADNESQAKQKLRAMGIMLISIKEEKADAGFKKKGVSLGSSISSEDVSLFTRQLATLIKARITVVESLSALEDQADNQKLKVILSEVKQKVNEGTSLANALKDYPKVFNNVYTNMVDAGEQSGTLDIVLLRLAEFAEGQVQLKNKIKGAMMYPLIMVIIGALMMGIIFVFVIPKITKIFVSMKKELPLQTKISIWISDFTKNYWWAIIVGIFVFWTVFARYISTKKGEERWDKALLKMPIVSDLVTMINVSRFASTLSTLLASSVPILTALKIVSNLIGNIPMKNAVLDARESVSEGQSLAGPLERSGLYPAMVTHMVRLGEKSGELEQMLGIVAENYEDQVNTKLNGLTSVLEPIMMVAMGGAVGFIIFSVVAPMMEINKV